MQHEKYMKTKLRMTVTLLFLLHLPFFATHAQDMVITDINLIDVEKGKVKASVDVYIADSKISKIRKHRENSFPDHTQQIDGQGRFLVPGYINSHVHLAMGPIQVKVVDVKPVIEVSIEKELPKTTLQLLLANGVTTARDPGGLTEVTVGAKEDVRKGRIAGPTLFVAGSIIDTAEFENLVATAKTNEEIRKAVQMQHQKGVDFIKLYTSLNPDQLRVGIEEAKKCNLNTIAHLHTTSWTDAARLGIDNIVHIVPGNEMLLPEEHREAYRTSTFSGSQMFYKWFEYADLDGYEIQEMIAALKKYKVSIDPTLVVFHAAFFGNTDMYKSNKNLDYLPAALVDNWKTSFNFNLGWTEEDFLSAQRIWPKVERFTKMLFDAGLLMTAGTDANNPWITPGDSFHKELCLLANAGISNADVLKIATINGARLLEIDHLTGSIEAGKEADLVVLNDNPLQDIKHTQNIYLTIKDGKVFQPENMINSGLNKTR